MLIGICVDRCLDMRIDKGAEIFTGHSGIWHMHYAGLAHYHMPQNTDRDRTSEKCCFQALLVGKQCMHKQVPKPFGSDNSADSDDTVSSAINSRVKLDI